MTKQILSKDWIRGIIDAEGCFDVHIFKNKTMKVGEQVQLRLIVTQKSNEKVVLKAIGARPSGSVVKLHSALREFFGAEDKEPFEDKRDGTLYLHIQKQDLVLTKIIPFFHENPLLTDKRKDFEIWTKCAEIVKEKRHTKPDGLAEIKELGKIINAKEKSVGEINPEIEAIELTPGWVSGFLEGDGSLILDIWQIKPKAGHEAIVEDNNSTDDNTNLPNKIGCINVETQKFKVGFRLEVGLHSRDGQILKSLDKYFGNVGQYNLSGAYPHWSIRGIEACHKHVLPFYEANLPIFPKKLRRFNLWREALILCHEKKHLTQEGANRLVDIYNEMAQQLKS